MRTRLTRAFADLDYSQASPLGWRHGTIIVWAGMRGVVTLAAAQTLPSDTVGRPLLIFVAFLVALISLLLQGTTLPWLVRDLGLAGTGATEANAEEQSRLDDELRAAAASALTGGELARRDGSSFDPDLITRVGARMTEPPDDDATASFRDGMELRLALIETMRTRLNELSEDGSFSTPALRHSLAELDADQISLELRLEDGS
jgi:CPA1 family monovalent cation:H+ antiporter